MGNDAHLYCLDCNKKEFLMRAYYFKEELINKKLDKKLFEELIILVEKINSALKKNIFSEDFNLELLDEAFDFYREHKNHSIFLIDDYFEEKKSFFGEKENG